MNSYEPENFKDLRNNLFLNNSGSFSPKNQDKNTIFFPTEHIKSTGDINDKQNLKNINLIGIYKSASITFYSKSKGYLLCKEFRDNKLVFHPIGGKYEDRDGSIEYTACREFIEESGILKNNDFLTLLSNYTSSDENIITYNRSLFNKEEQKAIEFIYDILTNDKITNYYDFYVNIDKEYIHKYYLINIDNLCCNIEDHCIEKFKKIIENIDIFYEDTFKEIKNNNEYIQELNWNKKLTKENLNKKKYSMLTIYLRSLLKSYKYKNNKS